MSEFLADNAHALFARELITSVQFVHPLLGVTMAKPVRTVHLTMLNESRSIVLEFKSVSTTLGRQICIALFEDQISLRSWGFTVKKIYQIRLLPYRNNVKFFRTVWNSYSIATHQVFIRIWISITSERI